MRRTLVAILSVVSLAACGSRVDHGQVVVDSGSPTVSLDPASIAALRAAATRPRNSGSTDVARATSIVPNSPSTAGRAVNTAGGSVLAAPPAPAGRRLATPAAASTSPARAVAAAVGPETPTRAESCGQPGAPLRLGQVGDFSGVAGPLTESGRTSLAAWVQAVNDRGGLACHPVVLYSEDDGADPSKAAALVQDLVEGKHVQALVGVESVLAFPGMLSGVERAKIPVIGGDGVDFAWNHNPYLFPTGAGTPSIIRNLLKQLAQQGKTSGGLLYCVEASACTDAAKLITTEAPKAGEKILYSAPVSVTQTDYTAQCVNAKNAGAQVLGLAMDGPSMSRVARSCAAINYHPLLAASSLSVIRQTAEDPEIRRDQVAAAAAVAPWLPDDTPGQREYHAAMAKYAPTAPVDAMSITIWAAGKLLEVAIAGLGPKARTAPITTTDLFTGLGTIHSQSLGGLIPPITFSPGQKAAPLIDCAYFQLLTEKGWTVPHGSQPVCA
jgi:branched-chain amino acid transport system substrate-binding protein